MEKNWILSCGADEEREVSVQPSNISCSLMSVLNSVHRFFWESVNLNCDLW